MSPLESASCTIEAIHPWFFSEAVAADPWRLSTKLKQ
jgi:hypothetical protein